MSLFDLTVRNTRRINASADHAYLAQGYNFSAISQFCALRGGDDSKIDLAGTSFTNGRLFAPPFLRKNRTAIFAKNSVVTPHTLCPCCAKILKTLFVERKV